MTINNIMLFDLATGGHHSSYIRYFINYCCDQELPIRLIIVVSPEFIDKFFDIVEIPINRSKTQIEFVSITEDEYKTLINIPSLYQRMFKEWNLHCKYARNLKVTYSLLMYLDTLQIPIIFGQKSPCKFAAIYFRPTFHYKNFKNYRFSCKDKLKEWRKKIILFVLLNNPQFDCLFSLDQFAVESIQKLSKKTQILHLPDPVEITNSYDKNKIEQLRKQNSIDSHKKIFLLFGSINQRKGIYQLLEAIKSLPIYFSEKICLLIVGSINASQDKILIKNYVENIFRHSRFQVIVFDRFVSQEDEKLYFCLSDVILAPYQKHVGMSGILLLASANKKPVISSNYGLMGHLVEKYKLGLAVDTQSPQAINKAIVYFAEHDQYDVNIFDPTISHKLAEENSASLFSRTLFQYFISRQIDKA